MQSNYAAIRSDNERRFGTEIGRIGQMLMADRYDDRTHFIYELLQNAEDALSRRQGWNGSREVKFALSATALRVSHFGKPFDELDVRGICGIAESTKDLASIGRFGIGFKSVYAFTKRPEIHSGAEDFAIKDFVLPEPISRINRKSDETVFCFPINDGDASAVPEVAAGLQRLGSRSLLFLREIEEISWSVEGGPSGVYLRGKPELIGLNGRKSVLLSEGGSSGSAEETWLVFSRQIRTDQDVTAGYVEIAFALGKSDKGTFLAVQPINDTALVVFFPTILPTHLGFLMQGPYRTTPSRDNVPRNDSWNQHLVNETATLLVEALESLRDLGLLDTSALQSLPLDPGKFGDGSLFAPLFIRVKQALVSRPLLPAYHGNFVSAQDARLARTQELRSLIDAAQLGALCQSERQPKRSREIGRRNFAAI